MKPLSKQTGTRSTPLKQTGRRSTPMKQTGTRSTPMKQTGRRSTPMNAFSTVIVTVMLILSLFIYGLLVVGGETAVAAIAAAEQPAPGAQAEPAAADAPPASAAASQTMHAATPQTAPAAADAPPSLPLVSLHLSPGEFPRLDGSTATIPLSIAVARAVTGMRQNEAEAFIFHTKTSQSIYNLASGYADLLLVYTPPDSLFEDLAENWGVDKSSLIMAPIGRDALVFLVNEQNPVKSLAPEQIVDIYTGKTTDWSQLHGGEGKIIAFQRNKESGSQVMMENLVMKGTDMAKAPAELIMREMEGLIESVAEYNNSGNALGYSVYYYFNNMYNVKGVRSMDIGGVPCTDATIRDGSYPFTQDFYAIIRRGEPANSNTRKLFNLLTGAEGPALIAAAGYTPVRRPGEPWLGDGGDGEGGAANAATAAANAAATTAANAPGGDGGNDDEGSTGTAAATTAANAPPAPSSESAQHGAVPLATLATIKRAPQPRSFLGGIFSCRANQNIFPVTFGKKTGFVNGRGELVFAPEYDRVFEIGVYKGYMAPLYDDGDAPIYYFVSRYKQDEMGIVDFESREYAAVLGPPGNILYETTEPDIYVYSINMANNSMVGYRGIDGNLQFVINSDGSELTMGKSAYITNEIYGDDGLRVVTGQDGCYLVTADGKPVSDAKYDAFISYGEDGLLFRDGERLILVDGGGKLSRALPEFIRELQWVDSAGLYIYAAKATDVTADVIADVTADDATGADEINIKYPDGLIMDGYGLMSRDFEMITEPRWTNLTPMAGGRAFIALEPLEWDNWWGATYIIDKSGNRISERDYIYIYNSLNDYYGCIPQRTWKTSPTGLTGLTRLASLTGLTDPTGLTGLTGPDTYYLARASSATGDYSTEDDDIINDKGEIVFSDTSEIQVDNMFGDYASMRLMDENGEYMLRSGGLKYAADTKTLASLDSGWIIPPVYDSVWPEPGGRYIVANSYSALSPGRPYAVGESVAVFDTARGKLLFCGDYQVLVFQGFRNSTRRLLGSLFRPARGLFGSLLYSAPGLPGSLFCPARGLFGSLFCPALRSDAVFYAETALRKGLLDEHGRWIVCLSKFDTLAADD